MAVSRLNNAMLVVETDAKQLASSLRTISRLADNISGKVCGLWHFALILVSTCVASVIYLFTYLFIYYTTIFVWYNMSKNLQKKE